MERSYSIKTLLRLNSGNKLPQFRAFFVFYASKCPRILTHRRETPTDACRQCGHCSSEEWKYSQSGYEFYTLYFGEYDKKMIRKEIQGILNKIVEDTFHFLSKDLIRVIKKVESKFQLIEAISLLYNKALIEPNYMELYASVCTKLTNVRLQDRGREYTFERELSNLLYKATAAFPLNGGDKKKFLQTMEFSGYLYQKQFKMGSFINELIDKTLKFKDPDFAGEGLCKILPLIATTNPKFLKQLECFSQIKPTSSRIKFLMMDALDSIAKEPCKGEIFKKPPIKKWNTNTLRFHPKVRFKI